MIAHDQVKTTTTMLPASHMEDRDAIAGARSAPFPNPRSQEAVTQCVSTVMRSRQAVRAFDSQPLHRELVEDILEMLHTPRAAPTCSPGGCTWSPAR
jgi:hypothetical protein